MSTATLKSLTDFSDKLNPMLVKELRQGLKGLGFVCLFIALQAFLALIMLTTAAGASYDNAGHLLSRIIFFFFSVAVLIIQPLRGISALHTEIKGSTIDLLCLTRLSAWRIAFGKWVSLVSQSALILTAIIPYLILRYFFGDMQLFSELFLLLTIFLLSMAFTAMTVGFSALNSVILRVIAPLGGAMFVLMLIVQAFASRRYQFQEVLNLVTLQTGTHWLVYLGFTLAVIYTTWICLDLGTSIIAPIAENRATFKRCISMILIGITTMILILAEAEPIAVCFIAIFLCLPILFLSLTESAELVPPVTAPFTKLGTTGKWLGRFLYPGWATGLMYSLLLYLMVAFSLSIQHYPTSYASFDMDHAILCLNIGFGSLYLTTVLLGVFRKKITNRMGFGILFTVIQCILFTSVLACNEISRNLDILPIIFWIPLSAFGFMAENSGDISVELMTLSFANLIGYFIVALLISRPVWPQIQQTEQQNAQP
ncbi:hypothetical protein HW115_16725 [Verrucomicrobiaceae bacterium N1E253]|uniref:Uncharacterized protein n=1 Tax=Oceaniferula marina TaxID=2748318 RepID=A0A851GJC0_9BACT|nr:hypothetical protein [Oceaniferula marina]NWK57269.1 hypothetical protein [Oceaniferula marina]